jgi:hypothetical protein
MNVPEPIVVHVDEAPRPRWAWCRHNGYALGRTRVAGTRAGHGLFIGRRSGRRRNCTPFQFELIHSRATAIREQHVDEQVEVPTHPSSRSCHRARASRRRGEFSQNHKPGGRSTWASLIPPARVQSMRSA